MFNDYFSSSSLHPNGTTLAASGNDGTTRLFDIRKFHDCRGLSSSSKKSSPKSLLCSQVAGLSVSSSFFSPSGKTMLTTSFANRLNLTDDMHLRSTGMIQPTHSIRHNNQTGKLNLAIYWYICVVEVIPLFPTTRIEFVSYCHHFLWLCCSDFYPFYLICFVSCIYFFIRFLYC